VFWNEPPWRVTAPFMPDTLGVRPAFYELVGGDGKSYPCPMKCAENMNGAHMPLYEHVMIARQDLSNTQAEGLIEHFGTVLADNGGKLVDHEYWGVKTMAYKINKNRKGHYAFLRTDAPSAAVQEMERLMGLHDDVMRVLTIKVDVHEDGPSAQMQKREERGDRGDRPDRGERRERR
jgi:small subunit ribosomal protein S6